MKTHWAYLSLLVITIQTSYGQTIVNSDTAYVIKERDLVPEGIAFDKRSGRLFISSIHKEKVIVINSEGDVKDFTQPDDMIWSVLGMEVDEKNSHLWITSTYSPRGENEHYKGRAALLKIDLETGDLLDRFEPKSSKRLIFNDLTIDSQGNVYITESLQSIVYKYIAHDNTLIEYFNLSDKYNYLNGITIDRSQRQLYVAHEGGVVIADLQSNEINEVKHSENISLSGIDGMAFFKNTLICHQASLKAISKYTLNKMGNEITGVYIMDKSHPSFNSSTTGEVGNIYYYYLANAQLKTAFEGDHIKPYEKLEDIVILKWKLQ